MTLEKDEENKKYYISYPKPPALDMKSANRDVNVVRWPNIANFSALDDLVTPLRVILCDVLADMIFGCM